jgi:hypothetical protein
MWVELFGTLRLVQGHRSAPVAADIVQERQNVVDLLAEVSARNINGSFDVLLTVYHYVSL